MAGLKGQYKELVLNSREEVKPMKEHEARHHTSKVVRMKNNCHSTILNGDEGMKMSER